MAGVLKGRPKARAMLVVGLVAAGALATAAAPADGRERVRFVVPDWSKGGHEISLFASNHRREPMHLMVGRAYGSDFFDFAVTSYLPRPSQVVVRRSGVRGKLGELGSVAMRFHARRKTRRGCVRRAFGVLKGRFRFRGEDGYLRVAKKRLPAMRATRKGSCRSRGSRRDGAEAAAARLVMLDACTERNGVFAIRFDRELSLAGAVETARLPGGLRVHRMGTASLGRGTFTYNRELTRARLAPPPPFAGAGHFTDGELTGDLTFSAPGAADIALTPARAFLFDDDSASGTTCDELWDDLLLARRQQVR